MFGMRGEGEGIRDVASTSFLHAHREKKESLPPSPSPGRRYSVGISFSVPLTVEGYRPVIAVHQESDTWSFIVSLLSGGGTHNC